MPRKRLAGTFEGKPAYRWKRMYRGVKYVLLLRGLHPDETPKPNYGYLDLPEDCWTEQKSLAAANRWWEEHLPEIDQFRKAPEVLEKEDRLDNLDSKIYWLKRNAPESPELEELVKRRKEIASQSIPEFIDDVTPDDFESTNRKIALLSMYVDLPDLSSVPSEVKSKVFGNNDLWSDRQRRTAFVRKELRLKENVERFITLKQASLKSQSVQEQAVYLRKSLDLFGEDFDCSKIDESTMNQFHSLLVSMDVTPANKNKRLTIFRSFVKWLWTENIITKLPRNIGIKEHRFRVPLKKIKTFANVKEELDKLPMPMKLWALLALNCGMTQADLGELKWDMIDLDTRTLTRKRVKRDNDPNSPTVTYRLFDETIALLKKHEKRGDLVFTTKTNSPMYVTEFCRKKNKNTKKDMFSTEWGRLSAKPAIPLGKYRSIGSTTLKKSPLYRPYSKYYLAHSPGTIEDKHYGQESNQAFFEALKFMHQEIFEEKK